MLLSKRQVKGVCDILKQAKKNGRGVYATLMVQDGYTYVTDAYSMVRIKTHGVDNGIVPFEEVEKWYKLASASDYMTTEFITANLNTEGANEMPRDLKRIFGDPSDSTSRNMFAVDMVVFNNTVTSVSHDKKVKVTLGEQRMYLSDTYDTDGEVVGLVLDIKI